MDRRIEILNKYPEYIAEVNDEENCSAISLENAKDAMDEYMKECCLLLLEYMATLEVDCYINDNHEHVFYMRRSKRDEILTKEQLFENFL
jgi:hypothetical protein